MFRKSPRFSAERFSKSFATVLPRTPSSFFKKSGVFWWRDVQTLVSCAGVFRWRDRRYAFCSKPVCEAAQTLRTHPYLSVPIRTCRHQHTAHHSGYTKLVHQSLQPAAISAQRTAAADFADTAACPSGPSGPFCQVFRHQTCASAFICQLAPAP